MLNSIILSLAAAFIGCGGSGEDSEPAGIVLTVSPESISAPAEGGTYTVNVSTTGQEWGTAVGNDFFTVKTQGTTAQAGTLTITVPANPVAETRSGAVTVMSGSARKTVTVTQAAAEKAAYYAPEGYYLVWQDEFNEGTELNKVDWTHEVQNSGWVNHELQNYVNHTTPKGRHVTELMDGKLLIHCFKEDGKIYSGRVYAHVKEGWKYGYIEASIKLPKGKGTWPAFWMMPVKSEYRWPKCGEIDIMEEVGVVPNDVSSSLHTGAYNHVKGTQKTHHLDIDNAEGGWHVYACEWTPDAITTFVDGKVQLAVTKAEMGEEQDEWPFHYAFYPILNLAWGGDWGGMEGVDESALPITMKVDYIRVFQKKEINN